MAISSISEKLSEFSRRRLFRDSLTVMVGSGLGLLARGGKDLLGGATLGAGFEDNLKESIYYAITFSILFNVAISYYRVLTPGKTSDSEQG